MVWETVITEITLASTITEALDCNISVRTFVPKFRVSFY